MNYDNYVFDLYGTLIDLHTDEHATTTWKKWFDWLDNNKVVHPSITKFRNDFFRRDRLFRKQSLEKGIYTNVEIDVIDVYRELFAEYGNPPFDDDFLYKASYAFRVASREYIRLYPGVIEFLSMIKDTGRTAYILSNAQRSYTWPEICEFDLDKLTAGQLISSDYGCMKPDVHFYKAIIDKYNLNPSTTVMLGDSFENDVKGAQNAGLNAIHLSGTNSPKHFYVEHLFDLI